MKTVLITGCSTGFGLEAARRFLDEGWRVVATMRTPDPEVLPRSERLHLLELDVTDPASVRGAAEAAGPVDALVNNAGVGLMSVFEGTSMAAVRATFDTNVFGLLAVTQALLPGLRSRRGVVVNVSSSTTLLPLPLLATYTATKAAVEAFSASLALELEPFGVRVHVVLPGRSPETPFARNAQGRLPELGVSVPADYAAFVDGVLAGRAEQASAPVTRAGDVAEAIWFAVTDAGAPHRIPAGADAVALAGAG